MKTEKIIAVSACDTIEETLRFAIDQMQKQKLDKIVFYYANSKYIVEKTKLKPNC